MSNENNQGGEKNRLACVYIGLVPSGWPSREWIEGLEKCCTFHLSSMPWPSRLAAGKLHGHDWGTANESLERPSLTPNPIFYGPLPTVILLVPLIWFEGYFIWYGFGHNLFCLRANMLDYQWQYILNELTRVLKLIHLKLNDFTNSL